MGDTMPMGIRTAVLASYEMGKYLYRLKGFGPLRRLYDAFALIHYACGMRQGPRGKIKPMDVAALVEKWIPVVVRLAQAHDRDEFDEAEATVDGLLAPILTAPIKQVRQFYVQLLEAMKQDKRVPMIVWMGFEAWGSVIVNDAADEPIKRLKSKLAAEIAELVESEIRPQIPEAIARALRWRDPEQLEAVKEQLQAGHKPKLKGRESCLFLEVGRGKRKATVML